MSNIVAKQRRGREVTSELGVRILRSEEDISKSATSNLIEQVTHVFRNQAPCHAWMHLNERATRLEDDFLRRRILGRIAFFQSLRPFLNRFFPKLLLKYSSISLFALELHGTRYDSCSSVHMPTKTQLRKLLYLH